MHMPLLCDSGTVLSREVHQCDITPTSLSIKLFLNDFSSFYTVAYNNYCHVPCHIAQMTKPIICTCFLDSCDIYI